MSQQLGFFTLATLLRPSIPITRLFTEAQLVNRTYGPPCLKVLAAQSLNAQLLKALESAILAVAQKSAAAAAVGKLKGSSDRQVADTSEHRTLPNTTANTTLQRPSTAPASTGLRLSLSSFSDPRQPPLHAPEVATPSDPINRHVPSTSTEQPAISALPSGEMSSNLDFAPVGASCASSSNVAAGLQQPAGFTLQADQASLELSQDMASHQDLHATSQAEHDSAACASGSSSSFSGMGSIARQVKLALQAQGSSIVNVCGESEAQQEDGQWQAAHAVLIRLSQQVIMPVTFRQDHTGEESGLSSALNSTINNTVDATGATCLQTDPPASHLGSLSVQRTRTNPLFGDLSHSASTHSLFGSVYLTERPASLPAATFLCDSAVSVSVEADAATLYEPPESAVVLSVEPDSTVSEATDPAATAVLGSLDLCRNTSLKLRALLLMTVSNKESDENECGVCMERSVGVCIAPCSHTICGECESCRCFVKTGPRQAMQVFDIFLFAVCGWCV